MHASTCLNNKKCSVRIRNVAIFKKISSFDLFVVFFSSLVSWFCVIIAAAPQFRLRNIFSDSKKKECKIRPISCIHNSFNVVQVSSCPLTLFFFCFGIIFHRPLSNASTFHTNLWEAIAHAIKSMAGKRKFGYFQHFIRCFFFVWVCLWTHHRSSFVTHHVCCLLFFLLCIIYEVQCERNIVECVWIVNLCRFAFSIPIPSSFTPIIVILPFDTEKFVFISSSPSSSWSWSLLAM